jgi:hypothetical protein
MNDIKILNPLEISDWDDQILSLPGHSFFHSAAWARVLHESYGYRPLYFSLLEGERIRALLPMMEVNSFLTGRRGVSLPFSDSCPPLLENQGQLQTLLAAAIGYGKGKYWKYLEIRGEQFYLTDSPVFQKYLEHVLDLKPGEEKIIEAFRGSTWRNVEKAKKNGVKTEMANDLRSLRKFYGLHCDSRKRHGLPPQPFDFFKKIHQHIISQGQGFLLLAIHNGSVVSGNIFFHFGQKALYKYGASDKKKMSLRASNLAMWQGIKWYADQGYETLSLGRTDLEDEGLDQFKRGWGTASSPIKYYRYNLNQGAFLPEELPSRRFSKALFHKSPVWLLKAVGSATYKHVG